MGAGTSERGAGRKAGTRLQPAAVRSEKLLDSALDVTRQALGARRASVMLVDAEARELWVKKWRAEGRPAPSRRSKVGEGVAGFVAETGKALVLADVGDDPRFSRGKANGYKTKALVSVPVIIQGKVRAVLNASDKVDGTAFSPNDLAFMTELAGHVGLCLEYGLFERRIQVEARTDSLTGLANRRYFEDRVAKEIAKARRTGSRLALLMLDLNEFKAFNDTYGHVAGDAVLAEVGLVLRETLGKRGLVCRYGGDEFTVILPDRSSGEAQSVATEIEAAIAERCFTAGPLGVYLTIACGAATLGAAHETSKELVTAADAAMYRRKRLVAAGADADATPRGIPAIRLVPERAASDG